MVIKADQFASWHRTHIDKQGVAWAFAGMLNVRGRDTVKEWGERLAAEHRLSNPLELPDFMKPKAIVHGTPLASQMSPSAIREPKGQINETVEASSLVCATCGKHLSPRVVKFCQDKAARFRGNLYCYAHQASAGNT